MSVTDDQSARIEAENKRIQDEIEALPSYEDPHFWPALDARGVVTSPEVLVHIYRAFRQRARPQDVAQARDRLIMSAYAVAKKSVSYRLKSHPDNHDDAVQDALITMWKRIQKDDLFWERNFQGAMTAACISACKPYHRPENSAKPLSSLTASSESTDFTPLLKDRIAESVFAEMQTTVVYEQVLASLDDETRDVVRLVYEKDLTRHDIAVRLACDPKTVYNRLKKATEAFAAAFDEGGA